MRERNFERQLREGSFIVATQRRTLPSRLPHSLLVSVPVTSFKTYYLRNVTSTEFSVAGNGILWAISRRGQSFRAALLGWLGITRGTLQVLAPLYNVHSKAAKERIATLVVLRVEDMG